MQISLDYIAGLIDADGSFSISLSDRGYKKNAVTVNFAVNLRQMAQYAKVLEDVRETLGIGRIYNHVLNMKTWQTTNVVDTLKACKILYPHLIIKKDTCKTVIETIEEWHGEEFNKHTPRNKHQLTRPLWLIEKTMDTAINLNKSRQTATAYKNKKERVEKIKLKIKDYYKVT